MADEFDASQNSAALLTSHVLQKGFQAGSVIGVALVAPVMCIRTKSFSVATINKAAAYSSCVGTLLSGAMLGAKMPSMDQEGLEDRVYRLHHNEGQNRTDRFCQVGGVLGAGASAALVSPALLQILGGAALGTAIGVAAHVATSSGKKEGPNKMLHELKTN